MNFAALALTILLAFAAHGAAASTPSPMASNDQRSPEQIMSMVRDYIRGGNLDLTPDERAYILQSESIEEVTGWPFLDRLKAHRFFAVQMGWNRQAYVLVVVSLQSRVWHIGNEADFNELLRDEGILIGSDNEARDLAQLFLKCQRVSAVMFQKWDLGMNLVTSLDDIDFRNEIEKREVAREIVVEPPRLIRRGELFEYVLYSWDKYGSGAFWQHRVVINSRAVLDYQVTLLRPDVGKWKPF